MSIYAFTPGSSIAPRQPRRRSRPSESSLTTMSTGVSSQSSLDISISTPLPSSSASLNLLGPSGIYIGHPSIIVPVSTSALAIPLPPTSFGFIDADQIFVSESEADFFLLIDNRYSERVPRQTTRVPVRTTEPVGHTPSDRSEWRPRPKSASFLELFFAGQLDRGYYCRESIRVGTMKGLKGIKAAMAKVPGVGRKGQKMKGQ